LGARSVNHEFVENDFSFALSWWADNFKLRDVSVTHRPGKADYLRLLFDEIYFCAGCDERVFVNFTC